MTAVVVVRKEHRTRGREVIGDGGCGKGSNEGSSKEQVDR